MSDESNDSIKWLQEIEDIPAKAEDPLAREVLRRFNGAVSWQSSEQVNGKSLRTVLEECWQQQNGVLSCADKEVAATLGVDAVINMTALKTGTAMAYLRDSLIGGSSELPWVIRPTPRPTLSPDAQDAVLDELKREFFSGQYMDGPSMIAGIQQLKRMQARKEQEKAERSATAMMYLIEDQCAEGGFNRALNDFLQYFTVYPFAVFTGPYIVRAPKLIWGRHKPRMSTEVFPAFRAVSPFDFCYSPDSPDTQRGSCVFTRTLWTRRQLLDATKLPSYITKNVLDLLKDCDSNVDFNLQWLSRAPDSPQRNLSLWSSNVSPIEVLTHYGVLSGRELSNYELTGLDDDEFYNCEIAMAGHKVIMVKVNRDLRMDTRPIYTTSFYRTNGDRIAGDGIAQRLRDVERAYQASLRYLMRNAANASAPLCEADYNRLIKHMSEGDFGNVVPGMMYLADSDVSNQQQPALRFFNIPSNIPAYMQLMEMFMQIGDRVTNIPAALHGEAVGSGAMRTFRGMSMLQGNATKAFHAAVSNLTTDVFEPLGTLLYNYNMLYSQDKDVKGDSQIITKGAEGLLQKEMEKQSAMEILQLVGSAGASLNGVINVAPVLAWSLKKLLGSMGVPDDVISATGTPTPSGAGVTGVSAGPDPNPAPPSLEGEGVMADVNGGES